MKFRTFAAIILALTVILSVVAGCITDPATGQRHVDPVLVQSVIDDAATLATSYAILFTEPGPDQDKLLAEIALARTAANLPALTRIIADLKGQPPATQPSK
jgi:hypothetical protein